MTDRLVVIRGYMDLYFFFKVDRGWIQTLKEGANWGGPSPNFPSFLKVFRQNRDLPPPVDCAPSPVLYTTVLDVSIS